MMKSITNTNQRKNNKMIEISTKRKNKVEVIQKKDNK